MRRHRAGYVLFSLVCFALNVSCTSPTSWLRRKLRGVTAEHTWPCMFALRQGGVVTTGLFCTSETSGHAPAAVHMQRLPHPPGLWVVAVYQPASNQHESNQHHHTHNQQLLKGIPVFLSHNQTVVRKSINKSR